MTIAAFDHLSVENKKEQLIKCCGSDEWVEKMIPVFPVEDLVELLDVTEEKWNECSESGWLQAFEHHPKIGNINSLQQNSSNTKAWAENEQSGVNEASENILADLAKNNEAYFNKFGFIFIVCATGRSANEMANMLQQRLQNDKQQEIKNAAEEQLKITKLRLEKLFDINVNTKSYEL